MKLTGRVVGVDRGVHVLAATSEGELLANRKANERHRRVVAGHQRQLDAVTVKDARGRPMNRLDPARIAAVERLARAKEREANARLDHAHAQGSFAPNTVRIGKTALRLVRENDVLGFEALNLRGMTRSAKGSVEEPGRNVAAKAGLNRDAGFGLLRQLVGEKAGWLLAVSSTSMQGICRRRAADVCAFRRRVVGEGALFSRVRPCAAR